MKNLRVTDLIQAFLLAPLIILALACSGSSTTLRPPYWRITLNNQQKMDCVRLDSVSEGSLYVSNGGRSRTVRLVQIDEIRKVKRSYAVEGLLVGVVLGATAGYYLAPEPESEPLILPDYDRISGGLIGFLLGGGIGAGIGAAAGADEVYDLWVWSLTAKVAAIKALAAEASEER